MDAEDRRNFEKDTDQYYQYTSLPKILKRFSFAEKMAIAAYHSSQMILFNKEVRKDPHKLRMFPWCLETFVMLSMEAVEYSNGSFNGKNYRKFRKMHEAIWEETSFLTDETCGRFSFVDLFLPLTGLSQFEAQGNPSIRQYRYWRIFNNNSDPVYMGDRFKNKMGTTYNDFLLLGHTLQGLFLAQSREPFPGTITQRVLRYLLWERFPAAAAQLSLSRSQYVDLQKKFAGDSEDPRKYVYSLCPSCQFAFITEKDRIYIPLPHLLNRCVSSSLLYRITDGDDDLRIQIGKHLWEKYLFSIVSESGVYQSVCPEQSYIYRGNAALSPDVLAIQNGEVLFIDSKSTVPQNGIRTLDPQAFEKNIAIVAKNVKQLYLQMLRFEQYNPFGESALTDQEAHWGLIVVLEDAYIPRQHYYVKAKELLREEQEDVTEEKWCWMTTHLKVVSLYEIERISLSGKSLIDACKYAASGRPFDIPFAGFSSDEAIIINPKFLEFEEFRDNGIREIVGEMENLGLLDPLQ